MKITTYGTDQIEVYTNCKKCGISLSVIMSNAEFIAWYVDKIPAELALPNSPPEIWLYLDSQLCEWCLKS